MKNKFWIKLQAVVLCLVMLIGISFVTQTSVLADDIMIDSDKFEDQYYTPPSNVLGYEIDPDKEYEIVNSALFNDAGQEVWDLTKNGKMEVLTGQVKNNHNTVKLASDGTSKGSEIYFWNEKSPKLIEPDKTTDGRTSFGRLFPGYDATEYKGIRIYLSKEKTDRTATLQIITGYMYKGYWPTSGFYTYQLKLPTKAYEGYVYLPFEDFKNNSGASLSTATPNFIAFKYNLPKETVYETYIGELGLWREGTGGIATAGEINIGLGASLEKSTEYMFYNSYLFNNSTEKQWEISKYSGLTVTPQYKADGYYPSDAKSSVKISITGKSKTPEVYFWDDKAEGGSKAHGLLFSKDINITDYDGIRLWVKTNSANPYTIATIMLGSKAYYQSDEQGGYYSYNLVIYGGFEGYVNIPFENFVNLKGESLPVKDFNFIGFKHGEGAYVESDIYFANLQVYGLKSNETYQDGPVGEQIDTTKKYEIVNSTLFNKAGQEVWNLTKVGKWNALAGQQKNKHSVVKLTTAKGEKSGEIYFWNEKGPALPEEKLEGRTPFGKLFPGYDATEYSGIRLYVNKAKTVQSVSVQVLFGNMSKGYWPNSKNGFFTYEFTLPKSQFDGYVYMPFKDFINTAGAKINSANPNFIAFKYNIASAETMDTYIGELGLYRQGKGGVTDTGELNIGVGEELNKNADYMFYDSYLFNNSNEKQWEISKLSGVTVTPQYKAKGYYPSDAKSSVKIATTGKSKYPEAFFWNDKAEGGSKPHGILFSKDINITNYDGIRLWVKAESQNPYATVTIMLGSKAYYQSDEQGGYYSYNLVIYGGFEGYVNIPFKNFVNLRGESVEVKDFNFIAFKHGEGAYAKSEIYFSNLQAYGLKSNNTYKDKFVGEKLNTAKKYEIVNSTLFNKAGQEVWDLTKVGKWNVLAGQQKNKHSVVKLTTANGEKSGEIYFWNEKGPALPEEKLEGRTPFGKLFPGYDATEYSGIRLYVNKAKTVQSITIQVLFGNMSKGYWPNSQTGFFTYEFTLPKSQFDGYVYMPFKDFVNTAGAKISSASPNFIAFKYNIASPETIDTYIGELGLYREGKGGIKDTGALNIGIGEELSQDIDYMFYESVIFNNSSDRDWAKAKLSGVEVTPACTDKGYYPSGAKSSIKLSTTGKSKYPEAFFWNEKYKDGSRPLGILFGTNINITDYDGIRLWVNAEESNPYAIVTVMLGSKAYYQSEEQGGYYSYNIVIDGGFEGYVNIPFKNFVNLRGESVEVKDFNFIAFKHGEGAFVKSDIYFADLQLYGLKSNNTATHKNVGIQLDKNKEYELVSSLVFADASQTMWEQTKSSGMTATVGITDKKYIPKAGMTSVKIHTTGERSSPEMYYWNELSDGGRRTHARFWGNTDCSIYDGIRFWIKIDENNTYSKLTVYLGQMYTGYWPKAEVGFFGYDIVIPRGGFEGYVNIPFSSFVNLKGEKLNAQSINFIAFKYNETGFKEADFWISDLNMYRVARPENQPAENSTIVSGTELQVEHIVADGTINDTVGKEYRIKDTGVQENNGNDDDKSKESPNFMWIAILAASVLILIGIVIFVIILIKRKKKNN